MSVEASPDDELKPRPQVQLAGHEALHHLVNLAESAREIARSVGERAEKPATVTGAEEADDERFLGHVGDAVPVCDDDALDVRRRQRLPEDVHGRDAGGDEHRPAVAVNLFASIPCDFRGDHGWIRHAVHLAVDLQRGPVELVEPEDENRAGADSVLELGRCPVAVLAVDRGILRSTRG